MAAAGRSSETGKIRNKTRPRRMEPDMKTPSSMFRATA
jgi:hypothetical protein